MTAAPMTFTEWMTTQTPNMVPPDQWVVGRMEAAWNAALDSLNGRGVSGLASQPVPGEIAGLVKRLEQMALPDPHDERDVPHAPLCMEAADAIKALEQERDDAKEGWYLANGTADLAMKHRDEAESDLAECVKRSDHWLEYWNGNENERAMADALHYILDDIRAFRDSLKEMSNDK